MEAKSNEAIEKGAICGDRFGLIKGFLRYVKAGERRIQDVAKVGPASVEKCTLAIEEWDKVVKARETTGQCKGIFFSTFGQKHMFRRCEEEAVELCSLCDGMREKARKDGIDTVSIEGQEAYEVVNKALFTRAGVVAAMTYWEKQGETIKKEGKVHKLFPFFTAQHVVQLLMMKTGVIFGNGGKGGRVYKRSRVIVEAQDRYVKECMGYMLTILRKEKKKQFEQRLARVVKIARVIHDEMLAANVGSDMQEVGAIQTSDVVREELCRAAKWTMKGTKAPRFLSVNVKQLSDWAAKRKKSEGTGSKSEVESSVHSPSTSPPASVSSSPSSPQLRTRTPMAASRAKKPLVMRKVEAEEGHENTTEVVETDEEGSREGGVPVFKKFEIRESTIPGAGEGLFLTEAAVHDEAIARYSGTLMSKVQAKALKSRYKVKISEDQYLCAGGADDWEGQKANCARKAKRKCNARFAAGTKCNFCKVTGKHWIKIFAVGDIEPQEEVLPDYGDEYWPEEDSEEKTPLPPPRSNKEATPSSGDEEGDSDSSWRPSPMVESEGRRKQRSSRKSAELSTGGHQLMGGTPSSAFKHKIYAVTVGRCLGMFRSAVRVRSSVFKYPGQSVGRFTSEVEARAHLVAMGITEPKCFWKSTYESGTLMRDPDAVVGQDVHFPVGVGMFGDDVQHGIVTESMIRDDRRIWKVQMDDGFIDCMSEWPLLCGLSLSEERIENMSSSGERETEQRRTGAEATGGEFFAIRGTSNDGIVQFISEVFPRLEGDHAEYETFDSRSEAQEWIDERQFFAVKLPDDTCEVIKKADVVTATRGKKGVQVKGPSTRKVAADWVRKWKAEQIEKKRGVFVRRPSSKGKSGCIARLKNGSRCGRSQGLRETQLGPMCKQHALLCKSESEEEDEEGRECIARLKSGDPCGRTEDLQATPLGPMCKEHASMCKSESGDEEEVGQEHFAEGAEVNYAKRQRVKAPNREEVIDVRGEESSEAGVRLPAMIESLKKDRKGMYAVVAVRAYPDEDCPEEPAGSVWLSSDKAAKANVHNGEMRIFNDVNDIFENISLAHDWIKSQLSTSTSTDMEGEADKRWQEAQERMKKRKADKKGKRERSKPARNNPVKSNKGKGGRGTGKGNRGSHGAKRGAGRGGRGAGRGNRKAKGDDRKDGGRDQNKRKPKRDESSDGSSEDESIDTDEDTSASGPSSGDRRFRKSRRRGRIRGGLRSGAMKMLDKKQKRVENQLFGAEGGEVVIYEFDVPDVKLVQKIPLPGKARAFTPSKDADTANHVITFGNDMKAELAEKHYKSFEAFSFAELMEFKETVEYVASYQSEDKKRVTESVVEAVRVIARNATHLYSTMRDSDTMGNHGENFKAYTYVQIMYLVMFREAFDNSLAEMFFMNYAPKFATMARGCPGMAPFKDVRESSSAAKASSKDRCLVCGKPGHRADSDVHKAEFAEGSMSRSPEQLKSALAYIASDATLNAEQKRSWSARIKAFWAKMKADSHQEDSL